MFGVGMPELLVILAVALIVVGPKRLPEMARTIGGMIGRIRAATSEVQRQVEREMSAAQRQADAVEPPAQPTRDPEPPTTSTPDSPPSNSRQDPPPRDD